MRFLYALTFYLVLLAILAGGGLLYVYELHELYEIATRYIPDDNTLRYGAAAASTVIGIGGLLLPFMFRRRRKSRTIEFQSRHGYIVIELDSVQKSLQKAMAKLPEVKDISLQVHPSDRDRKVRILAEAAVIKPPGVGIRETVDLLYDKLDTSAKQMLGVDDIASLDLRISRTLMNVKEEFDNLDKSRLLEHKAEPAPAPAPAPAQTESKPSESSSESTSTNGSESEPASSESEPSKEVWR